MLIKVFQHLVANVEVEDLKFLVRLQDRVIEIEEYFSQILQIHSVRMFLYNSSHDMTCILSEKMIKQRTEPCLQEETIVSFGIQKELDQRSLCNLILSKLAN